MATIEATMAMNSLFRTTDPISAQTFARVNTTRPDTNIEAVKNTCCLIGVELSPTKLNKNLMAVMKTATDAVMIIS